MWSRVEVQRELQSRGLAGNQGICQYIGFFGDNGYHRVYIGVIGRNKGRNYVEII